MDKNEEAVKDTIQYIENLVKPKVPIHDVLQVVQTTFESCMGNGYFLKPGWKVPSRPLVRKIAQCRIADYLEYRTRHPAELLGDFNPPAREDHDTLANREESRRIWNIVASLDKRYRQVVEARYCNDRSDREIAHETRTPVETIRTRHKRAIKKLRQIFKSEL